MRPTSGFNSIKTLLQHQSFFFEVLVLFHISKGALNIVKLLD